LEQMAQGVKPLRPNHYSVLALSLVRLFYVTNALTP